MKKLFVFFCIVSLLLGAAVISSAAPVIFFGEDLGLGENTPLASWPNASAAETAFLSNLEGVGTENFESFTQGTSASLEITFPGAGTATLMLSPKMTVGIDFA